MRFTHEVRAKREIANVLQSEQNPYILLTMLPRKSDIPQRSSQRPFGTFFPFIVSIKDNGIPGPKETEDGRREFESSCISLFSPRHLTLQVSSSEILFLKLMYCTRRIVVYEITPLTPQCFPETPARYANRWAKCFPPKMWIDIDSNVHFPFKLLN